MQSSRLMPPPEILIIADSDNYMLQAKVPIHDNPTPLCVISYHLVQNPKACLNAIASLHWHING